MGAREVLQFDEATHTYTVGGAIVPGVTSILKPLIDFSMVPPDVLARKADLGRRVHFACQLLDEDDLDEDTIEPDVAAYLDAYRLFKHETRALVLLNEQQVFHKLYRYAGTLDRVLSIAGVRWLIDLKTCFTTPMSAGPQTAAYQMAMDGGTTLRRGALRLRPDGTYRLDPLDGADDWSCFMSCLTLLRFKESHRD
jgi:hypothetical protein